MIKKIILVTILLLTGLLLVISANDFSLFQGKMQRVERPKKIDVDKIKLINEFTRNHPDPFDPYKPPNLPETSNSFISSLEPKSEVNGINSYFIENQGTLDCKKKSNKKFCSIYNNAKKYYGLGTYPLNKGDMVIVEPFMFRWVYPSWFGQMEIFWIGADDKVKLLAKLPFSQFGIDIAGFQNFQGVYIKTELKDVSTFPTLFHFTDQAGEFLAWCKEQQIPYCSFALNFAVDNEEIEESQHFVGFADSEFDEYNKYFTKSLENCYAKASEYLGIQAWFTPISSKGLLSESGGGCAAGGAADPSIICSSSYEFIKLVMTSWMEDSMSYPELVEKGQCLSHSAQSHEITHILIADTPIAQDRLLNEGLAQYVQSKVAPYAGSIVCLDSGYKYKYYYGESDLFPYANVEDSNSVGFYETGACIWDHIEKTYGHESLLEILDKMEELRFTLEKHRIFKDLINPIVGEDLLPFLKAQFGIEQDLLSKGMN